MENRIMEDNVVSSEIVYSKGKIIIKKYTHESGFITYAGENNNKNAVRTYLQCSSFEDCKEYILCLDWKKKKA